MLQPQPSVAEFAAAFTGPNGPDQLNSVLFASIADYLGRFFESDYLKGPMAYGAMSGSDAEPLRRRHRVLEILPRRRRSWRRFGCWAIVEGGMGSVTKALASALRAYGGEIRLEVPVAQILYRRGRAAGVVLDNGDEIAAEAVLANPDPKTTLLKLTPTEALDADDRAKVARIKAKGSGVKINFALAELPDFATLPGKSVGPQHSGGIMIAPSLDYYDQAWQEARRGVPSSRPFSQMIIQSATDPTVAPEGRHTLSLWCHHFPYTLASGDLDHRARKDRRPHDRHPDRARPQFSRFGARAQIFLPVDIERTYGIEGGQIFHTELVPEQVLWNRPIPGRIRPWRHRGRPLSVRRRNPSGWRRERRARPQRCPRACSATSPAPSSSEPEQAMQRSTLRQRLKHGETVIGTMVQEVRTPAIAQILKQVGFDFLMLDMEHGAFNLETAAEIIRVARLVGIAPLVRVAGPHTS